MFSCPTFSEFRFYGCCHPLQLFFSYAIDVIIRFYVHLASLPLAYKLEMNNGVHWICNGFFLYFFPLNPNQGIRGVIHTIRGVLFYCQGDGYTPLILPGVEKLLLHASVGGVV